MTPRFISYLVASFKTFSVNFFSGRLKRVNALELDEFLPVFRIVTQSANSLVPCLITQPVDPHDLARKFLLFSKLEAFHISCIIHISFSFHLLGI